MNEERRLVLVLDNDRAVRNSLKFALELEGLNVRLFDSADHLLADTTSLRHAGCLVLDHDLRSTNGFDILARLQDKPIPVILMTDNASDTLRRRATALGVRHIVEKPLLNGALIESINDVLDVTHSAPTT